MYVVRTTEGAVISRLAVVATAAILVLVLSPSATTVLDPGPHTINITNKLLRTQRIKGTATRTYLLFNRQKYGPGPIGSEVAVCRFIGRGGILGNGAEWCSLSFSLPKGTITAHGVVRNRFNYLISITGGTDLYNNIAGGLAVNVIGARPLREQLVFTIQIG